MSTSNSFLDDFGPRGPFARGIEFTSTGYTSMRNKMTVNNEVRAAEYTIDTTSNVRLLSGLIALIDPRSPPDRASSYVVTAKLYNDVPDDVVFAAVDEAIFAVEQKPEPATADYSTAINEALREIGALSPTSK